MDNRLTTCPLLVHSNLLKHDSSSSVVRGPLSLTYPAPAVLIKHVYYWCSSAWCWTGSNFTLGTSY